MTDLGCSGGSGLGCLLGLLRFLRAGLALFGVGSIPRCEVGGGLAPAVPRSHVRGRLGRVPPALVTLHVGAGSRRPAAGVGGGGGGGDGGSRSGGGDGGGRAGAARGQSTVLGAVRVELRMRAVVVEGVGGGRGGVGGPVFIPPLPVPVPVSLAALSLPVSVSVPVAIVPALGRRGVGAVSRPFSLSLARLMGVPLTLSRLLAVAVSLSALPLSPISPISPVTVVVSVVTRASSVMPLAPTGSSSTSSSTSSSSSSSAAVTPPVAVPPVRRVSVA